jgi:anti-sigma B factor antagonist
VAEYRYYLRGDLDLESAGEVRTGLRAIIDGTDSHVLVDCSRLSFVDSTGIAVLLEAHRDLRAQDREMLVANVPNRCRKVFAILGLDDLLRYDRENSTVEPA